MKEFYAMLVRKSVTITDTRMDLRDEANNYLHSYDRMLDREMCVFLDKMIEQGHYELRSTDADLRLRVAA